MTNHHPFTAAAALLLGIAGCGASSIAIAGAPARAGTSAGIHDDQTRPAAGLPPTTTVAPTAPTTTPPLTPGTFDVEVPAVAGFTYTVSPAVPPPWVQVDLPHPVAGFAFGVEQADISIGSLIVVEGLDLAGYVDRLFDEPVQLQPHALPTGVVPELNEVRASWQPIAGTPVVAAIAPDRDTGQWVWGRGGQAWIAVGTAAMHQFVVGLIGTQQVAQPSNAYDYELLAGPLYQRLGAIPGYLFVDLPVAVALEQIPHTLSGDCAQRLFVGYVVTETDPDPLVMRPEDLGLAAATIGGVCADRGFFADLDAGLDGMAMRDDVLGGFPVRRNDTNVVAVDGDDVFHFSTSDPATLAALEPFLVAFLAGFGK